MRAQVSYVSWSNSSGRGAREEAPPNKREVCDAGKSTPAVRRVSIFLSLVGTLIAFEEAVCERETLDRCAQWDLNLIQPPRIYQYKSGCAAIKVIEVVVGSFPLARHLSVNFSAGQFFYGAFIVGPTRASASV